MIIYVLEREFEQEDPEGRDHWTAYEDIEIFGTVENGLIAWNKAKDEQAKLSPVEKFSHNFGYRLVVREIE